EERFPWETNGYELPMGSVIHRIVRNDQKTHINTTGGVISNGAKYRRVVGCSWMRNQGFLTHRLPAFWREKPESVFFRPPAPWGTSTVPNPPHQQFFPQFALNAFPAHGPL